MATPKAKLGKIVVRQLPTNADLMQSIKKVCVDEGIHSGIILTAVGSLHKLTVEGVVRSTTTGSGTAFGPPKVIPGPLQLLTLGGFIFQNDKGEMDVHLHITVADTDGKINGAHLIEGGSPIATRLQVAIAEVANVRLVEKYDESIRHFMMNIEQL